MITLGPVQYLAAQADTANVINCFIEADTITPGATPPDLFGGRGPLLLGTTPQVLLAAGTGQQVLVKSIALYSAATAPVAVAFYSNGTAAPNQRYSLKLPAGGSAAYEDGHGWVVYDANGLAMSSLASLGVPLPVNQGGTGQASFAAGQLTYGNGTSPLGSSANLTWDGSYLHSTGLGVGTASPRYPLDVVSTGAAVRIGFDTTDSGGYLISQGSSSATMAGGAINNGTNWIAKSTQASIADLTSGQFSFYANSGLTVGGTFTPTLLANLTGSRLHLPVSGIASGVAAGGQGQLALSDGSSAGGQIYFGSGTNQVLGSSSISLLSINAGAAYTAVNVMGQVGVGSITSPTAALQMPAGTAAASTSPLKFSAGTNLTTAEAGAWEYDGNQWYETPSSAVRMTVQASKAVPAAITAATYTQLQSDTELLFNTTGGCTITLLSAASYPGRKLWVQNLGAQALSSVSGNVIPAGSTTAGAAILPATTGAWAVLESNGLNWQVLASSASTTLAPNSQAGTSYTLALGDAQTGVTMGNAAANTLSVPTNASVPFPVGIVILIEQTGSGQTTIAAVAPGTTTINSASSLTARAQYSVLGLWKTGTDAWTLFGDMT